MNLLPKVFLAASLFGLSAAAPAVVSANELSRSEKVAKDTHEAAKRSQTRIDQVDLASSEAREEYLSNERSADVTEAYNRQLAKLVESQEAELADLDKQLLSLEETDKAVLPMLGQMVATLDKFVAADLPFLPDERIERVEKLHGLLNRADVSVAEKYRQILEAYLVEAQYGRTLEAYSGRVEQQGAERQVTFLRIGRTALYYQTRSGDQSALWEPSRGEWRTLSEAQNLALKTAIAVARQQQVPSLLELPMPKQEARS
ncbi:DUF3450 domain-containing protein [Neptunomonas sp. XY-337]|uniref:DUF3450 domain-containing protein n=1 Tax=Neptunomonas sp. XY-337 TaxID=2561897 RepID=UPI0010AA89A2|nr:DUF3450 domain-containing protein [Neptunomonas sp. XY-337]